jgi:hypothetical protein
MNCCGQKRQQWQQKTAQQEPMQVSPVPVLESPVLLCYHGSGTLLIKGSKTGYLYLFAPNEPGLTVDMHDAQEFLMQSGKFSLANKTIRR